MNRNKLTFNQVRDMFFEAYPQFKAERKRKKETIIQALAKVVLLIL